MKGAAATAYFIVRNRNHLRTLTPVMAHMRDQGHKFVVARYERFRHAPAVEEGLDQQGLVPIRVAEIDSLAQAGDIVVFSVYSSDRDDERIVDLSAKGVRFVQIIEGARFQRQEKYRPELPVTVLIWGTSGREIEVPDVRIVGAPALETTPKRKAVTPKTALINYKFTFEEKDLDPDFNWATAAVQAAHDHGYTPVLSGHPNGENLPDNLTFSDRPFEDLLCEADILISRASTAIFQALFIGVQPFYLTVNGDLMLEFSDPMGAFPICKDGADLQRAIIDWQSGARTYSSDLYMAHHVSIDDRPAALRAADEILKIWNAPAD